MYLIYSTQCSHCIFLKRGESCYYPNKCENPEILKTNDKGIFDEDEFYGDGNYINNYDENDDCNLNCKYFIKKED
jgi:hypothetical protein